MTSSCEDLPGRTLNILAFLEVHDEFAPVLQRALHKAFPGMCVGRVEDAVQAAAVAIIEHTDRFDDTWASDGADGVKGLMRVVAWRHLRGCWRKYSHQHEIGFVEGDPIGSHAPGQELVVGVREVWTRALEQALDAAGGGERDEIKGALLEKLDTGDPDTVVARRLGVRREYLNRAKLSFKRALRKETSLLL